MKNLIAVSGGLIALAAVGLSQQDGSGVSGLNAIAARQASLDMSSLTFRSLGEAMKAGEEPKSLGYASAALAKWAKALPGMFPAGTGQGETVAFSQALPAVWKDRAGFDKAAADYADATRQLAALAQENDKAGFTKQLDVVNRACSSCHARYKAGAQGPPKQ